MTPAEGVVRTAAEQAGLDVQWVERLRDGSNALFRLPGGVVARVGRPSSAVRARREIDVAGWLDREGIAVVRPVGGVAQPTIVDDRPVTWWEELRPHRPATPGELGGVLRSLHRVSPPTGFRLKRLDPFAGFSACVTAADQHTDTDRQWLVGHLERLRSAWVKRPDGLLDGVIHGDAWQGNVAVTENGDTALLDLEHVAIGPPEWDLAHLAADYADFARISRVAYRSFVDAYGGYDVTAWPGFRMMADVVELRWLCFALGRSPHSVAAADEARHRIACLRGDIPRPWVWNLL